LQTAPLKAQKSVKLKSLRNTILLLLLLKRR